MALPTKLKIVVFAIWFAGASALVLLVGYNNQRVFDPHLTLSTAIMDLTFESAFSNAAELPLASNNDGYLVHIGSNKQCACQFIARNHQSELDNFAAQHNVMSLRMHIEDFPKLAALVPSVPAVAFFDSTGSLRFFGPYSDGAGCFGTYGFIDVFLQKYFDNESPQHATIVTEATGCYCAKDSLL